MPNSVSESAQLICDFAARMVSLDLTASLEGNISVRFKNETLLCTPAGIPKFRLRPNEIVHVDLLGNALSSGSPTSELALHLAIYRDRPDCQAIVHAHPPFATALAWSHAKPRLDLAPEALMVLGAVALVPYFTPGTAEVDAAIRPFAKHHKSFLLANHGAVTLGSSVEDAFCRMEILERVCRVGSLAGAQAVPLPSAVLDELVAAYGHGRLT